MNKQQRWGYAGTAAAIVVVVGTLVFWHPERKAKVHVDPLPQQEKVIEKTPTPPPAPVSGPVCPPSAPRGVGDLPKPRKDRPRATIVKPEPKARPKVRPRTSGHQSGVSLVGATQ